jgi:alkanesulfonate monooxygenase SsuD/methylene tetrahydromethanopterin reductase-like flavin-dependent oxidoreductase (luciferase family)
VHALTGERFSFEKEFFTFIDVGLTPTSFQRPLPPILIGSHSLGKPVDRSLDFDGWVLWFLPEWSMTAEWARSLRGRTLERGKPDWSVVINQDGWLGDEPTEVRNRHALRWLRESRYDGEHDYPTEIDASIDITKLGLVNEPLQDFEARQVHFGTADSWIERIGVLRDMIAPDWPDIRLRGPIAEYGPPHPTFDETLKCIRRFEKEVMPAFR